MWSDAELTDYLLGKPRPINVHTSCRKTYTNKKEIQRHKRHAETSETFVQPKVPKLLRSVGDAFDWKQQCFYCCSPAEIRSRKNTRIVTSTVMTLPICVNIINICHKRNDPWALEVAGRLNSCHDLVAAEAFYHRPCYWTFVKMRDVSSLNYAVTNPVQPCSSTSSASASGCIGRPVDIVMYSAFDKMCKWFEVSDDELHSLDELQGKIRDITQNNDNAVYSVKQLKRKLEERYGEHFFFPKLVVKRM